MGAEGVHRASQRGQAEAPPAPCCSLTGLWSDSRSTARTRQQVPGPSPSQVSSVLTSAPGRAGNTADAATAAAQGLLGSWKGKSQGQSHFLVPHLQLAAIPVACSTPENKPHLHVRHSLEEKAGVRTQPLLPATCHMHTEEPSVHTGGWSAPGSALASLH